jgi:hypothetical protein
MTIQGFDHLGAYSEQQTLLVAKLSIKITWRSTFHYPYCQCNTGSEYLLVWREQLKWVLEKWNLLLTDFSRFYKKTRPLLITSKTIWNWRLVSKITVNCHKINFLTSLLGAAIHERVLALDQFIWSLRRAG